MKPTKRIRCSVCGKKTQDKIREDTVLKNYPLYCPKCKQETLIDVKDLQTEGMKQAQGITEQLKEENALEWMGWLNNIRDCAREIVKKEIIYIGWRLKMPPF